MKSIEVVAVGPVGRPALESVAAALRREYGVPCSVSYASVDPAPALHPERRQYHSTEILQMLSALRLPGRTLGVTHADLYIPILTFVFGEAQLNGTCALVSTHRLSETFYGLPFDDRLSHERLMKCAIHEIGHTEGLIHCDDQQCVMAAAHAVEWLDLKGPARCEECRERCASHQHC